MKKTSAANPRGIHVELKSARGRTPSSQRWLRRQLNDPFVRKAQAEGYRGRAAYKMIELQQKFNILRPGLNVVDIGCAPGGWLQVIRQETQNKKNSSKIIGIDLLPTEPLDGVIIFQGDAREEEQQRRIWETCAGSVDVVLSDMAAAMSGHAKTDQMNVAILAETAWDIAEVILAEGGHFACKVFAGGAEQDLLNCLKTHFKRVKHVKPDSSRKESREMYLVASERKTQPTLIGHPQMPKPSAPPVSMSYSFDDVLIEPGYSQKMGNAVDLSSKLTSNIALNIPILSSAMDTVTESRLAIAIAQQGGMGVIHKNMTAEMQATEIGRVKRFESGMVIDPITIGPNSRLIDVLNAMKNHGISGIPVTDPSSKKLLGIVTNRDVRFARNMDQPIDELMTKTNLVTVKQDCPKDQAIELLHKHRIEKLLVVDHEDRCVGLITVTDIEKSRAYPQANKDDQGRLRVAAAVSTGENEFARAQALVSAGVDVLVLDTAHGHSQKVLQQVERVRKTYPDMQIIGGNVATYAAAQALIAAGVNAVKVGIGPGSICTTRIVAGIGVPQFSAIWEASAACAEHDIPCIADGGIRYSGDIVKALAAGASSVMLGSLLAGTQEAPGEVVILQGRSFKNYRGMGSQAAMARGSADRYFQEDITQQQKLVPEGVEGRVPFKGLLSDMIHQLTGGLRAGMGYIGAENLTELKQKAIFRQITGAGMRESHVHDLTMTSEPPNYKTMI